MSAPGDDRPGPPRRPTGHPASDGRASGADVRPRPDGTLKVTGEFAFSSDLWMADMLWGATLRSPHPRARIRAVDISGALRLPGVAAVLTHDDVPGRKTFGLEAADQPVLADDEVRYQGEPVAIVAADHPETARRAAAAITVDYQVLDPGDRRGSGAAARRGRRCTRAATWSGTCGSGGETRTRPPTSWSPATYEVGMQDQAFLGPESGLAVPAEDGGVELYVATQWLHVDQAQVAASLGLPRGQGAAGAGRRRRRVRRPRGPVHADPRVPAGAAHRPAGEDGLLPGGVVLRPRAPAPGHALLRRTA